MSENSDDLEDRFASWVEAVVRARRFWIVVGPTDKNTVLEDPEEDRDLQLLYATEADARADAERDANAGRDLRPDSMETDDLPALCDAAERRGDAFALWQNESSIVAEPDMLREELLRYAE
jgi:hypothetical protein